MEQYIKKSDIVAEIERRIKAYQKNFDKADNKIAKLSTDGRIQGLKALLSFLDSIEVKEVDLTIHTIIAECCNWLAMRTNLSHDEIEDCRNLMLTVKDEQCKV